jgi:hypothetical protein
VKESQQPLKLVIENSTTNGVRPVTYAFEIATDSEFQSKVYARAGVPPGDGGKTGVTVDRLDLGRGYHWRVRGEDGANASAYASASFEVLPKPLLTAPSPVTPINGATTGNRRPELKTGNSNRNEAVGFLRYDFQIADDPGFGAIASSGSRDEGGGTTEYIPDGDLSPSNTYYWRVRSSDGDTTSTWSAVQSFKTPGVSAPAPGPLPNPGGGGSCASNDGNFIVRCIAATYPAQLAGGVSHDQRVANMEFLRDRVIEAGICGGLDLARNLKRGVGPHSIDALAWRHNGIDDVVDIGIAYDDTSRPLALTWAIVAGPPGYDPYHPSPSCK